MKTAAFIIGFVFICCEFTQRTTAGGHREGFVEAVVQSECRDRYLWIRVGSLQTPRFEAIDGNDVHSISEQLASRCGYTISTFKMDGFTTFRASYYSCFTHNQNDKVFTFRFNVIVSDGGGGWLSRPVSAVCSGLIWTSREIICEEDYMEVNVNRESSCGGQRGESGQVWQTAFSQAQRTANSVWQLMFLQSDGQVSSMSISEAQMQGYSLTTTAQRVVLRSQYKQNHAKVIMVEGVPVEVVKVFLFSKKKLMVVMIDVSMACTVNPGSFDGARLLWDIPWVMTPLVEAVERFESRSVSVGVEGVLLDETTAITRGFSLVQQGKLVQIRVPLGAEGGYRKSLVVNNMYKELYVIFLLYEHVFSLLYEDGSSIETRHRMLRVLDTPMLCRPPFSLDQTISDDQVFRIYLGNIPTDVILERVWINKQQLMLAESVERAISVTPVVHVNGSRAYELWLPFKDTVVHWQYLGGGVVQYSLDINFTLTIMPQRDSYYHHTFITAQVFNAFPPEITAQCLDRGIAFSVVRPPQAQSLWEVGVHHEPLTSHLAAQRGYHLHNDTQKTTLEVPVFSIGYTYEGINLSNFYGTFQLFLRDSKTLEIQTSTSKRCLFKTEDMMACSADGTVTVVTTVTSTWPMVRPERTSLLDPTCGPKQTTGSRVLFEFTVDSCGTRAMVGELYMVYENEILHDRQLIAEGPNFISRESQFKLTVRCFYPLSGVNRLSVDRIFRSETPGFGSITVFGSLEDSANKISAHDCSHQDSRNSINTPTNQVHQSPAAGEVLPASRGKKYVFSDSKHKKPIPDVSGETRESLSNEPTSTAASGLDQNSERTGSIERRNIETVESTVKNIRVKPLSKFVSSGHELNQKPTVKQTHSQISNPSQYDTGVTAVSNDGKHWTSQPLQDYRGSNTRQEYLPEKTRYQTRKQEQGDHSVQVKLHQSAVIRLADLAPNEQGHQKKMVHPAPNEQKPMQSVETENSRGQGSVSTWRNTLKPTGVSHIRVRPGPRFTGRLHTHDQSRLQNLQNPDSATIGGTNRTSNHRFPLQNTSKTLVNIREYKPTEPNTANMESLNPTAGRPGLSGSHPSPKGSGGAGSDLKIHGRSDCGSQYGSSVHQGIMRGKWIS